MCRVVYCIEIKRFLRVRDRRVRPAYRPRHGWAHRQYLVPLEPFDSGFFFSYRVEPIDAEGFSGMSDRTIVCRDCGETFSFTSGEQAYYQERGFSEPQRCPSCRAARKAQRAADGYGNGGYSSGGYSRGGGYSSGPREMFPAVCSSCGVETEVPFQPRSDKPVYCRDCYQQQRSSSNRYARY